MTAAHSHRSTLPEKWAKLCKMMDYLIMKLSIRKIDHPIYIKILKRKERHRQHCLERTSMPTCQTHKCLAGKSESKGSWKRWSVDLILRSKLDRRYLGLTKINKNKMLWTKNSIGTIFKRDKELSPWLRPYTMRWFLIRMKGKMSMMMRMCLKQNQMKIMDQKVRIYKIDRIFIPK